MDLRRGQPSRDAVASSSGRYAGHRSGPVGLPVRRTRGVPPSPRLCPDAATRAPVVSCRASAGRSQQPTPRAGVTTVTAVPVSNGAAAGEAASAAAPDAPRPPALDPDLEQLQGQQPTGSSEDGATWQSSAERIRRLNTLVEVRRLYRNCVRAEYLLSLPSPLYTPPPPPPPAAAAAAEEQTGAEPGGSSPAAGAGSAASAGLSPAASAASGVSEEGEADRVSHTSGGGSGSFSSLGSLAASSASQWRGPSSSPSPGSGPSPEEDKALKSALDMVAEMALVLEQLKASLRSLPSGFGAYTFDAASAAGSEEAVRGTARQHIAELRERLAAELPLLPISSDAAINLIESRNAKFSRRVALDERQGAGGGAGSGGGSGSGGTPAGSGGGISVGGSPGAASALERLEAAERVAGEIIANSIKPALKKASEQDLVEVVRGTGSYLRGLWVRLNGGAAANRWGGLGALGRDLPLPVGTQEQSELAISRLSLDLEALEKRLQEASKNRETKLRKAGLQGRVQMAIQLKGLDAEVLQLSSLLAVRTLQLEMEYVYNSLEAEALDVFNGLQPGGLLARDGSTNELTLLVAEFALLDDQLTLMAAALEGGAAAAAAGEAAAGAGGGATQGAHGAGSAAPTAPSAAATAAAAAAAAAAAVAMGPALINDEVLSKLAVEIPDMRSRVGVADQIVFGGPGFSLTKARLQLKESLDKVREGVTFLTRGFKLLGSDVATGGRLFLKAAFGNTLKPREVSALRRTARDLLTFIPFTVILIIPLSPLGHVLVFGFIQRYFPSFFPSQFSTRRQDIMVRYEDLERQLLEAQAAAEAAEEQVELARAREAVARLVAPEPLPLEAAAMAVGAAGGLAAEAGRAGGQAGGDEQPAVSRGPGGGGGAAPGAAVGGAGGGGAGGGNGAAASAAAAAAAAAVKAAGKGSLAGTPLASASVVSSLDEVTLEEATKKVRILAEQLDEIRDDVHMSDPLEGSGEAGGAAGGHGGGGGGLNGGARRA